MAKKLKQTQNRFSDRQNHTVNHTFYLMVRDDHFSYTMFQEDPTDKLGMAQENPSSES